MNRNEEREPLYNDIRDLYIKGYTYEQIAIEINRKYNRNIRRTNIYYYIKRLSKKGNITRADEIASVEAKTRLREEAKRNQIEPYVESVSNLRGQGYRNKEICEELGISMSLLNKILNIIRDTEISEPEFEVTGRLEKYVQDALEWLGKGYSRGDVIYFLNLKYEELSNKQCSKIIEMIESGGRVEGSPRNQEDYER